MEGSEIECEIGAARLFLKSVSDQGVQDIGLFAKQFWDIQPSQLVLNVLNPRDNDEKADNHPSVWNFRWQLSESKMNEHFRRILQYGAIDTDCRSGG